MSAGPVFCVFEKIVLVEADARVGLYHTLVVTEVSLSDEVDLFAASDKADQVKGVEEVEKQEQKIVREVDRECHC